MLEVQGVQGVPEEPAEQEHPQAHAPDASRDGQAAGDGDGRLHAWHDVAARLPHDGTLPEVPAQQAQPQQQRPQQRQQHPPKNPTS